MSVRWVQKYLLVVVQESVFSQPEFGEVGRGSGWFTKTAWQKNWEPGETIIHITPSQTSTHILQQTPLPWGWRAQDQRWADAAGSMFFFFYDYQRVICVDVYLIVIYCTTGIRSAQDQPPSASPPLTPGTQDPPTVTPQVTDDSTGKEKTRRSVFRKLFNKK